jgi:outer membrane receptor protein involved in Fe transport
LFDPSLTRNPGYKTWDARASLALTSQVSATLAIDNLANADYSVPFGYQPLLRAARVGVRVKF